MSDAPAKIFRLDLELRPGYLYAHVVSPQIDAEIGKAYLTAIAEEIERTGVECVMLVRDIPAEPSVGGTFHSMQWFLGRVPRVQIAWVNPHPHLTETLQFAMTVAENRGARYRLFDTEAEAEAWLNEPS